MTLEPRPAVECPGRLESDDSEPTLASRTIRGTAWSVGQTAVSQLMRLVSNMILAWLLFPRAFGLMQVVNIFILGIELCSDIGLDASIVQNKRGDDRVFQNTAWTIQVLRGLVLWPVVCLLAWPIGRFYGEPVLGQLLIVVGSMTTIRGFASTKFFTANRHMMIGRMASIEIGSYVFGTVVAIVWALTTKSLWSLVAGSVTTALVRTVMTHALIPGPANRIEWDSASCRAMINFGKWVFVGAIAAFLSMQIDRPLLGMLISFDEVGVYGIAFMFTMLPVMAVQGISWIVIFPAFSIKVRENVEALPAAVQRSRSALLPIGLLGILFVVFGAPILFRLYDERYQDAIWMAQLLAFPAWIRLLQMSVDRALIALGDTKSVAFGNMLGLTAAVILAMLGYRFGGAITLAVVGIPIRPLAGFITGTGLGTLLGYALIHVALRRRNIRIVSQDVSSTLLLLILAWVGIQLPPAIGYINSSLGDLLAPAVLHAMILLIVALFVGHRLRRVATQKNSMAG